MTSQLEKQSPSLVDDDWVRAVARLIRLTEEGKLRWTSAQAPRSLQEQLVDVVFSAEYEGKRLRLHKEPKRINPPAYGAQYPYWIEEVVLELGDQAEEGWYTIPETEAAKELLESVEYQVYGVDDFLSKVLDAGKPSDDVIRN